MDIRTAAQILGGQMIGRDKLVCPGPGHGKADRSLSVTFDQNAPDGFLVNSFANDDWQECRDHVRALLGLGGFKPGQGASPRPARMERRAAPDPAAVSRRDFAATLWTEARPIGGTIAETYLRNRGIAPTWEALGGHALRFHPSCPFRLDSGEAVRLPTMIAAMLNIETSEFQGVHRTALQSDGSGKAIVRGLDNPRKMLGSSDHACVKLSPDEVVTHGLGIGEGIETCLSVIGLGFRPIWAALSAGTIERFPILGVDSLTIWADADEAKMRGGRLRETGIEAARACAARWADSGKEVFIASPPMTKPTGTDWNDVAGKAVAA